VLLRNIAGPDYKPRSQIWTKYSEQGLSWGDGTAKQYNIPWTPITKANADAMLAERK
jgi:putative xylitol transport system substrate-binding protein